MNSADVRTRAKGCLNLVRVSVLVRSVLDESAYDASVILVGSNNQKQFLGCRNSSLLSDQRVPSSSLAFSIQAIHHFSPRKMPDDDDLLSFLLSPNGNCFCVGFLTRVRARSYLWGMEERGEAQKNIDETSKGERGGLLSIVESLPSGFDADCTY